MTRTEQILTLAKQLPVTSELLAKELGITKQAARCALLAAWQGGQLDRQSFTVWNGAVKNKAYRYTLKQKDLEDAVLEHINKNSLFAAQEVATAIDAKRPRVLEVLHNLAKSGVLETVGAESSLRFKLKGAERTENKTDKCLQELKNYVTICLNDIEFTPYTHQSQKQVFSKIRAILERAEVKDV